jgi:hypothetical protein
MSEKKLGYTCKCGKFHEAGFWGAAHWMETLYHTCDCGRYNQTLRGRLLSSKKPKKAKP